MGRLKQAKRAGEESISDVPATTNTGEGIGDAISVYYVEVTLTLFRLFGALQRSGGDDGAVWRVKNLQLAKR